MPRKMTQSKKLEIALARLEERFQALQDDVKEMRTDISELRETANRWKGAFWIIIGLGGVAGVVGNLTIGWFK
jgi:SMC interacting uncharacterized protein involved in chromosome segregation